MNAEVFKRKRIDLSLLIVKATNGMEAMQSLLQLKYDRDGHIGISSGNDPIVILRSTQDLLKILSEDLFAPFILKEDNQ